MCFVCPNQCRLLLNIIYFCRKQKLTSNRQQTGQNKSNKLNKRHSQNVTKNSRKQRTYRVEEFCKLAEVVPLGQSKKKRTKLLSTYIFFNKKYTTYHQHA